MLLVDFRLGEDSGLEGDVLSEAQRLAGEAPLLLLADHAPIDAAKVIQAGSAWIQSHVVSRQGDLAAVAMSLALRDRESPKEIIRIDDSLDVSIQPFPLSPADRLLISRLLTICESGAPEEKVFLLHLARAWARSQQSPFSAVLCSQLTLYTLLIESKLSLKKIVRFEKIDDLATSLPKQDWKELTDGLLSYAENQVKANPEINTWLMQYLEFLVAGARTRKVAIAQAYRGSWCDFLIWLAVYFLQVARIQVSNNEYAASICCSVRALESYLSMWAISEGDMILDEYGIRMADKSRPSGLMNIWQRIWDNVDEHLLAEQRLLFSKIKPIIFTRNRVIYTHGVMVPNRKAAESSWQVIVDVLHLLEKLGGDHRRVFGGFLHQSSEGLVDHGIAHFARRSLDSVAKPL